MVHIPSSQEVATEKGFSGDKETIKEYGVVLSSVQKTLAVEKDGGRWEELFPDILASIFLRIPQKDMLRCIPLVCKSWMKVSMGPYCWQDISLQTWCLQHKLSRGAIDSMVKKLIRQSEWNVRRFSAFQMGESGFSSVVKCGRSLETLDIQFCRLSDDMVLKHLKPLPNLRVLDISYCRKFTAKSLVAFGNQCTSLIHLKRDNYPTKEFPAMDDSEAKAIADNMPKLQHLKLWFGRFGDSGLCEIVSKCKYLKHLDIRACWNVKLEGDLKKMCQKLECFRIHDCKFIESDLYDMIFPNGLGYKDPFTRLEARSNRIY
ncbi:unnamed protein product [Lactuca saligna]|uniref:F-box domain-containing protein n=1 Tax=Lactuca saligna TaxID=75948 RepID=A0AA35V9R8_LACSI|nr:unnamed protein product [Lactuca saligna]